MNRRSDRVKQFLVAASLLLLCGSRVAPADDTPQGPAKLSDADRKTLFAERNRLWKEAQALDKQGRLDEAISAAEKMLSLERQVLGSAHDDVIQTLMWLAARWERREEFDAAQKLRREVLEIRTRRYGDKDWRTNDDRLALLHVDRLSKLSQAEREQLAVAAALGRKVSQLHAAGKAREAIPLAEQALKLRQAIWGEEHPATAESLNNLAVALESAGEFRQALPLQQKALAIRRKISGEQHPVTAKYLNNLAGVYRSLGEYRQAVSLCQQELAIRKKISGAEHPDTASNLNALATLFMNLADYRQALPLCEQALAIRRKVLGEEHRDTAQSLNNLAFLHKALADYRRALPLYQQALAIGEKQWGKDHPDTATGLNNLAALHMAMGDHRGALPLYARALAIRKKVLGEEHPNTAASFDDLSGWHSSRGDYRQALPLCQRSLAIRRKALGEEHPDTALGLGSLAALYGNMGNYREAVPLCQRALTICTKALGEEHPRTVSILDDLAGLYYKTEDFRQALALHDKALEIGKKIHGEEHPRTATYLNNVALTHAEMRDYLQAKPLYEKALAIQRKTLGEEHPETAMSLSNLAGLYYKTGDFRQALALHNKALEIGKKIHGEEHPRSATYLNNVALTYAEMRDYLQAKPLYEKALAIQRKTLGEQHADTALSLSRLAGLYGSMGNYHEAVPLCQRALTICTKALGEEHPRTVLILDGLAELYWKMGDFRQALALYKKVLEIGKTIHGEEHPRTARYLNHVALMHASMRDYLQANPLYKQALVISEKTNGEEHPETATILNNLSMMYAMAGEYRQAVPLFKRALAIKKKVFGDQHEATTSSLNGLAFCYTSLGDFPQALPLYEQVVAIRKEVLGEEHPNTTDSLINMAWMYHSMGEFDQAEKLLKRGLEARRNLLDLTFAVQSERQQLSMSAQLRAALDTYLSLVLTPESRVPTPDVYRHVLAWKGMVLAQQAFQGRLRGGANQEVKTLFEKHLSVSSRLATLALRGPQVGHRDLWLKELETATREKELLEAELSQHRDDFRGQLAATRLTAAQLQQSLPRDAALVDMLEYSHHIPSQEKKGLFYQEQRLAAFVMRSEGPLTCVDLGPVAPLEKLIETWRGKVQARSFEDRKTARELREKLWAKLEKPLGDAKMILLSPDGVVTAFPWAALPGEKPATYLIEERGVAVVPVPQLLPQLLENKTRGGLPPPESLLLLGDVDYGSSTGKATDLLASRAAPSSPGGEKRWNFRALEHTRTEIVTIADSFSATFSKASTHRLRGQGATESAFRQQAPKHRFVHLATHGYFAPPQIKSALAEQVQDAQRASFFGPEGVTGWHPGLLSGLAMTGANTPPQEGEDDGILTAMEVAGLDLRNVDMVVLSACETGLGRVAGGEGVLGLQRAFQASGVRSAVSSLWSVDDRATKDLMIRFYENVWQKKLPKLEALRQAQLWMLRHGAQKGGPARGLTRITDDQPRTDRAPPYYWAAFVLSGDWR